MPSFLFTVGAGLIAAFLMLSFLSRVSRQIWTPTPSIPMNTIALEKITSTELSGVNFAYPFNKVLQSDRLQLTPFNPKVHAEPYHNLTSPSPHLYDYLPYGPFETPDGMTKYYEETVEPDPSKLLLAIVDTTHDPPLIAGTVGILNASPADKSAEFGFFVVPPMFGGTHVSAHALGLVLQYLLDPAPHGLGLQRVAYNADSSNWKSIGAAQAIGLKPEGRGQINGRSTLLLATSSREWQQGGGHMMKRMMAIR